ncbi:hypothetical protein [Maribacter sp. ACAM166]|uniref:hypothetical protein n=1 Tax=Maribacter sp. ACAM166 TaxID=2508996 RepID=UPI0010FDC794|nr:hypothetical protein [Maribacter sp. ACAM166]TLP70126.1 hypothetical protein ES765_21460 [Maribacter sp. ACAM166]
MALEKTLQDLIIKLNRPLLFFVPMSLIPKGEMEGLDAIELEAFFDNVVLYSTDGQINEIGSGSDYIQLFEKPYLFEKNILRLIDEQAGLNPSQFAGLMEKYILHLRFFVFITKWMDEHISEHCDISENLKTYFEFQKNAYLNHKQEIETKFSLKIITDLSSSQILTYLKKDTPPSLYDLLNREEKSQVTTKLATTKSQKKPNTDKQILITDKEARSFLLETVFNLEG